ncbi:MAG: MarR family transcriptional regulator [Actinobacteria bacterium]|nr:MarR family transcriptional regulator [Actinomycetota bacterium]
MAQSGERRSPTRDSQAREAWMAMAFLFIGENSRRADIAAARGLTVGELISLFRLPGEDAPSQRELAQDWSCDASWVTTTVDRLETLGLVERRPHDRDRRVKTVALTPRGRRVREQALEEWFTPPAALARLSDAEVSRLASLMRKLEVPEPGAHGHAHVMPEWLRRRTSAPDRIDRTVAKVQDKVDRKRTKVQDAPERSRAKVEAKLAQAEASLAKVEAELARIRGPRRPR